MLFLTIESFHWLATFFLLYNIGTLAHDILMARFDHAIDEAFERMGL